MFDESCSFDCAAEVFLPFRLVNVMCLLPFLAQSACVAPLLKELYSSSCLARTGVVLTIHNIAFQVRILFRKEALRHDESRSVHT